MSDINPRNCIGFVATVIGLLLCFSLNAQGASRGIAIVDREGNRIHSYANSFALIVGVSDYTNGWDDLPAIPTELAQVRGLLERQGFEVTQVMDPDANQLADAYKSFINAHGYQQDNRLLFYFSGHGFTRRDGTKGYIVPADAPNPLLNEIEFVRKAYDMVDLRALARKIEAHHALFLFDSCFAGTIFQTRATPGLPPDISEATSKPVRMFITAGAAGETVPANSIFTPAFVDAVNEGKADYNKDTYVTGMELGMYLKSEVSGYSEQNPQYGKIDVRSLAQGDFVFRLRDLPLQSAPSQETGEVLARIQSIREAEKADEEIARENRLNRERRELEIKEQWADQLNAMKNEHEAIISYSLSENSNPENLTELRQMFLKVYAEDNPYTDEDDVLRESVNDDVSEPWIDISAFDKISVDLIASTMTTLIDRYRKPATANDVIAESLGKDCDVCPEMMKVPAGNFQMGDLNGKGYVEEKPTHRVELNPFALSRTEITFEQYDAFARDTNNQLPEDRDWGRDDRAVIYVSWHEANTYAKWLSEKTNKHYRLPSEAEWEYAARAGSNTVYFWGNEIGHDKANCDGCGSDWDDKKTAPVAQFESNQLGLFDMHGNVWEWVQDCHRNSYNETPKDGTAVTQHPCTQRVLRGGSWFNKPSDLRAAARYGSDPNRRRGHFGFRIAQDLEPTLAVEETTPD